MAQADGQNSKVPASAEMLLLMVLIESMRQKKRSYNSCRKHLVGKMRRMLGREIVGDNVLVLNKREREISEPVKAAQMALKALCRTCRGCPLGDE